MSYKKKVLPFKKNQDNCKTETNEQWSSKRKRDFYT